MGKVVINPIIGPIVVFSLLILVLSLIYVPQLSIENQKERIEKEATSLIDQLKAFRGYYTNSVIKKVSHVEDLSINFDHKDRNKTIPLPATTIHNLSEIFTKESDMAFKFYSDYPFPNRADRKLDGFQKEAIAYLKNNPKKVYAREDSVDGQRLYRVAVADVFTAQGCVNCHNYRPDTPKNDWKLGDVRGVFEVDRELHKSFMLSPSQVSALLFAIVTILAFALLHYSVMYMRRGKELQDQANKLEKEVEVRTMDLMETNKMLLEYKKAVDASAIVSKTDQHGRITYVNDAFCQISGYSLEELIGKSHSIVRCHDIPSRFYEHMWSTIQAKKIFKGTIRNRSKSGDPYYVASTIVPILDHNNEISEYLSLRYNVTDLEIAKTELEAVNKNFRDSIEYASLIQSTFIAEDELFPKFFAQHFTIWEPKDIVGGDIYLFEELRDGDECLLFIIDCTGHGVHGAFVTMIVKAIQRHIVARIDHDRSEVVSPANLLGVFNRSMKHLLKQDRDNSLSNAGFDGAILYYNKKEKIVKCAGARSEILYIQSDKLHRLKGDRHSVGYRDSDANYVFSDYTVDVSTPTTFYLSTDGYVDQIGGVKKRSFGKKRLRNLISAIKNEPLEDQKEEFRHQLKRYQDTFDRIDDITFVAVKVDE
jgi:PAS domain S-box-containing protein